VIKQPVRTCVVTHNKCLKKDLLRIVKNKDGLLFVDSTGKANGKGAYITKSLEVLELAKKNKVLNKVFNTEIPDSLYEEIKNNI
jgi:uncharacterized protein